MAERPTLNRALVRAADFTPGCGVRFPAPVLLDLPERVVQFGTGGFLRGFVEYFIDAANRSGNFAGRIVAVSSTKSGRDELVNAQDGLFTMAVQGIAGGTAVRDFSIISSLNRSICARHDWAAVLAVARNPALELVFSNTTEVGIVLDESDSISFSPPRSFPGKLAAFLYERARHFDFDPARGLTILPCELIEDNARQLREAVVALAALWKLDARFSEWLDRSVPFCNTLVDRIVSGTPARESLEELSQALGYRDNLLTICEPYRFLAIEATDLVGHSLQFAAGDAGILLSGDIRPYRERKVRLLNGGHSIIVPLALLSGCGTVFDAVRHESIGEFLRVALFDEIVPTLDASGAEEYATSVLERFSNPFIEHSLFDITLHGTEKFRVRVIPSILAYANAIGRAPPCLAFAFAAWLLFMRGDLQADRHARGLDVPLNEKGERVTAAWRTYDSTSGESRSHFVNAICSDNALWGDDLALIPGFASMVSDNLGAMMHLGVRPALEQHLASLLASGSAPR